MDAHVLMDGLSNMHDSGTLCVVAALQKSYDDDMDAVPGLLETAAENLRAEGYGDDGDE